MNPDRSHSIPNRTAHSLPADRPDGSAAGESQPQRQPQDVPGNGTDFVPWAAHSFNLGVFKNLAELGYGRWLLPIVPAGTKFPIWEGSSLSVGALGKTPSVLRNGEIFGLPGYTDPTRPMTPGRLAGFHADASGHGVTLNVGILTGDLIAIDVDANSAESEAAMRKALAWIIDAVGERRGRQHGFLTAMRAGNPEWRKQTLRYEHPLDGSLLIECLCRGQQFAALGRYKATDRNYEWRAGKSGHTVIDMPPDELPLLTDRDALVAHIDKILTAEGWTLANRSRRGRRADRARKAAPAPETLLAPGGTADVGRLLERLPNPPDGSLEARDRDEWVLWGHRIFGATGGSPEGLMLFIDWSCRWRDDADTIDNAEAFWGSVGTPHVGWRDMLRSAFIENASDPVLAAMWDDFLIAEIEATFRNLTVENELQAITEASTALQPHGSGGIHG